MSTKHNVFIMPIGPAGKPKRAAEPERRTVEEWTADHPDFEIATKVKNPLVRYNEFFDGPYRKCRFCEHWFTPLGLPLHLTKCAENPDVQRAARRAERMKQNELRMARLKGK